MFHLKRNPNSTQEPFHAKNDDTNGRIEILQP
jgi:hypothetical protein